MDGIPCCTFSVVRFGVVVAYHENPSPFLTELFPDSLSHLHLHVISSDLCSPTLKHKKHYNSFHPRLGFFLHMDDVLSWFEGDNASFDSTVITPLLWVTLKFVPGGIDSSFVPR